MYYILWLMLIVGILIALYISTNNKFSKGYSWISISLMIFLTLLLGIRYGVGLDYFSYENTFKQTIDIHPVEAIYNTIAYGVNLITGEFFYVTLIMALITNYFIWLGLKKRKIERTYEIVAILIYTCEYAFIFANLMKQGVAVAIFFYCSTFIKERKFLKYLFFILIGTGFHSSMILLIVLYFIPYIKINNKLYICAIFLIYSLLAVGVAQSILNFLTQYLVGYEHYYNSELIFAKDVDLLSLGVLIKLLLSIVLLMVAKNKSMISLNMEVNYYKIGIMFNILSISSFMFDRIGIYFAIFSIVAIPELINKINKKDRIIFVGVTVIIFTSLFIKTNIIDGKVNHLEYKSIFEHKKEVNNGYKYYNSLL